MPDIFALARQNPKLIAYSAALIPLLALALFRPEFGLRCFARLERLLSPLAARRGWCVALFGVAGLLASSVTGLIGGVAVPGGGGIALARDHDEFSYVLAGDTFASGRLTNPPHPMWHHFESFHIIQQPTYMSKYPPGNGLLLGLGQWLSGSQALGLWIGAGLLCASLLWMLYAWFSPGWALFGAAIGALNFGIYSYWTQTYWGGALACTGGALLLGGIRRSMRDARPLDAVRMGIGIGILANTRPFEGLGLTIAVGIVAGVWALRWRQIPVGVLVTRTILPATAVLAIIGCWMAYYNYRVTGNPLRLPYQVYAATYDSIGVISGNIEAGRTYRNASMQSYYGGWVKGHQQRGKLLDRLHLELKYRGGVLWAFYIGPILTVPFVLSLRRVRSRWIAAVWLKLLFLVGFMTLATWAAAHYAAPGTGLFLILAVAGSQVLAGWKWRGRPVGAFLVRVIPAAFLLILCLRVAQPRIFPRVQWIDHRLRMQNELERTGSRHVIFVRYSSAHRVTREWVYNRADIDKAQVVWAHDLGADENRALLNYMKDRNAWLVEADRKPPRLIAYPTETQTARVR